MPNITQSELLQNAKKNLQMWEDFRRAKQAICETLHTRLENALIDLEYRGALIQQLNKDHGFHVTHLLSGDLEEECRRKCGRSIDIPSTTKKIQEATNDLQTVEANLMKAKSELQSLKDLEYQVPDTSDMTQSARIQFLSETLKKEEEVRVSMNEKTAEIETGIKAEEESKTIGYYRKWGHFLKPNRDEVQKTEKACEALDKALKAAQKSA